MPSCELATGVMFAGRYQVIEELGHGGMGRVYKVFDNKIREKVALKLIKPEISVDRDTIARFSNELKLARRIRHKNVCGMFDLGEVEGTHFITMEYIHGEDLKSMIRMMGTLGIGTVLSIGEQICDGLTEAHRLDIVHRDLKPQNIMIDKGGNVKIMDFGIARSLSEKGITGTNVTIGTPEYMSPEQVEAKDTHPQSDIYSLGVILYEMATGRVPFEGDTALSIAMKQKGEMPQDPQKLNPGIPDDLSLVILKCLEKKEEKRYQTATELRSALEKIEKDIPTTDRFVPKTKPVTSREITLKFMPKKLLIPGLVFLAIVVVVFVLWRVVSSKKPSSPITGSGQPILAVLYFENKSGDKKLDFWRSALPELLITDLSQSKYMRVVPADEMLTVLRKLGLAEALEYSSVDIGKVVAQTRATHVLRGSFIKAGESIIITAGLQKPGTGETPSTLRLEARSENDIIPKVDELTRQVKDGLNFTSAQKATDIEKEANKITTSSPEALRYYLEGRRYVWKIEYDRAIPFLQKAVEIDPEFGMAFRTLALVSGYPKSQGYLKKALELSSRLPENEKLNIEAYLFLVEENYAEAIRAYKKVLETYPGDMVGHENLASAYLGAGDIDKSIENLELTVKNTRTALGVRDLAVSYMCKGLYQKAEDICRSFLQNVEDNAYLRFALSCSYLCRRQFDLAVAEAESAYLLDPQMKHHMGWVLLSKDDIAGADKFLGGTEVLLARGRFNENISLCQRNIEGLKGSKQNEANAYRGLARAFEKAGRYRDAYQAFVHYLELSAENRRSAAGSGLPYLPSEQKDDLFTKARIQTEMKSFNEAQKTAEELKSLVEKGINPTEQRFNNYILGLIELGKSDSRKAVVFFNRACGLLGPEYPGEEFNHALYFDGLAQALYTSGDLDQARREYEKITLLTMGRVLHGDIYAKAYYMLGRIAEHKGERIKAREQYRKFLDLWKDADPGLPEVDDARQRLTSF
jgi:serine/threonine protein kinase/tetratricopeptide (TPR) repeat protein